MRTSMKKNFFREFIRMFVFAVFFFSYLKLIERSFQLRTVSFSRFLAETLLAPLFASLVGAWVRTFWSPNLPIKKTISV
ncbi:MAG: hypothetical protein CRN43_05565 [Candidatus Nephrothrix sp. EaCA]|nr:MAG: hypothetical protein CRN43_05565 [Candidatus Nephrothrix sp. EaCA]